MHFSRGVLALVGVFLATGSGSCGDEHSIADAARAGRPVIAVVPKDTAHEFWGAVESGAREAGRALAVDVRWKGPAKGGDREAQKRIVRDFIAQRVSGIVLAPIDQDALLPQVKAADRAGIPVVIIDSALAEGPQVSFVATDNRRGGELAARHLGQLLGDKGKVLMMRYDTGSASTTKREEGFLATLGEEFAGIEVVSENQYAGANVDGAVSTAKNLLIRFNDVDGIFCPNESTTRGMLRALGDGRAGTVKFVGFDGSEKLVRAMRGGHIHGLVLQNPALMGRLGVETLVKHLGKEAVDARVDTGVHVATPDNLDSPTIQALLAPFMK